ncbi:MAG: tetratricopeptide repeat protein [Planctomycetes bacterium]|nr:tetratricopeptide repeat protein [Planctomycetota bacterium]
MSVVEDYIRGTDLLVRGSYIEAERVLAPIARGGGLVGRFGRYYLGRCLRAQGVAAAAAGAPAEAAAAVRRAAELLGGRADLAGYLAALYARHVDSAHERAADEEEQARLRAIAQGRQGRAMEALSTLRTALCAHPQSAPLHLAAGMVLAAQDRFDEAAGQFQLATQCDCACAEAYRRLGHCRAAEGRFDEALGLIRRALSIDPGDLTLIRETLTAARAAGAAVVLPAEVGAPREEDLRRLAALVLGETDFVQALLALPAAAADGEIFGVLALVMDLVLAHHDDYADMHYRAALVQRRLGRREAALAHAERAVALNDGYVQARFLAGSLLVDCDPRAAAEHLRRAVSAGGDWADVHATLGAAYQRLGQSQDARREMARSLQINSNYTPAAEAMARPAGDRNGGR